MRIVWKRFSEFKGRKAVRSLPFLPLQDQVSPDIALCLELLPMQWRQWRTQRAERNWQSRLGNSSAIGSRVYPLFVVLVILLWSALEVFFGDVCWHPFHCVLSFTVCSCLVG